MDLSYSSILPILVEDCVTLILDYNPFQAVLLNKDYRRKYISRWHQLVLKIPPTKRELQYYFASYDMVYDGTEHIKRAVYIGRCVECDEGGHVYGFCKNRDGWLVAVKNEKECPHREQGNSPLGIMRQVQDNVLIDRIIDSYKFSSVMHQLDYEATFFVHSLRGMPPELTAEMLRDDINPDITRFSGKTLSYQYNYSFKSNERHTEIFVRGLNKYLDDKTMDTT